MFHIRAQGRSVFTRVITPMLTLMRPTVMSHDDAMRHAAVTRCRRLCAEHCMGRMTLRSKISHTSQCSR